MMNLPRWKVGLVLVATLLGLLFSLPNFLTPSMRESARGFIPSQVLNLGLDLQGGVYLLLEVDTDAMIKDKTTFLSESTREKFNEAGILFSALKVNGQAVSVRVTNAADISRAQGILTKFASPLPNNAASQDMAVSRGPDQTLVMTLSSDGLRATSAAAVDASIEIVRRRIDPTGTKEPSIVRQGLNRIAVEAPGESDPEELKRLIGQTAKLTFQMVDESVTQADIIAERVPPGSEILPYDEMGPGGKLIVRKRVLVSGASLKKATVETDQNRQPAIGFTFDSKGGQAFGQATSQGVGKTFAIILDGKVISAPRIISPITGGTGQITGRFTVASASEMVKLLNGGSLPAKLKVIQQRSVGAELGKEAIDAGIVSTAIGFLVIVIFMILAYGFVFGGVSVVALIVNLLLILASMTVFHATLTLPGVAGLILTLAVAVDANVLIYERIRDEERSGHKPIAALDVGFSRAIVSILDANITSLIAALIMFQFGAGPVKGFAWTLMIGVFTSVFAAIMVSQVLLGWWFKATKPKTLPI